MCFFEIKDKNDSKMTIKYKIRLRDLKLEYLKEYIAPIFNFLKPKKKITNISELKNFIQRKSAWVSQETLYGYLKTRMGAKYILMFEDEIFLGSINKAKWNIFAVALQDLTFYCLSYQKNNSNFDHTSKANDIYEEILNDVKAGMVIYADETGWRVNGDLWWLWIFANKRSAYYWPDKSRGGVVIEKVIGNIFFGILF
jgi:hypothetical protein